MPDASSWCVVVDSSHAIGFDIVLPEDAHGILVLNGHIRWNLFIQAAGRLRKLYSQSLTILLTQNLWSMIHADVSAQSTGSVLQKLKVLNALKKDILQRSQKSGDWRAENDLKLCSADSMVHFQSKNTPNNVLAMLDDGRPIVSMGLW